MMREILFRGKRIDNGEWVEGFYHFSKWYLNGEFTGEVTHYIRPVGAQDAFQVDPDTVGQFTGLTDKSGKRIFEGDIVKEDDVVHDGEIQIKGRTFLVTMTNGCWFGLSQCNKYYYKAAIILDCLRGEAIGNIHDNPELLEGNNE